MTITLTVRTAMWRSHVARVASGVDGLVPVVKGNGYGFGRPALAAIAAEFSDTIAVGTIHELDGLPTGLDVAVLTPTLIAPTSTAPILTIGNEPHIDALRGWAGRVVVKLASPMRRFGGDASLVDAVRRAGLEVVGVSIHPPLLGDPSEHRTAIEVALEGVDPGIPVWFSHLDPSEAAALAGSRDWRLRLGTALWHGDKSFLHLGADVLDTRPVAAGERAGYRQHIVEQSGHLVMIGAGSANGVTELADGRSPFHFERRRLRLHEPPHMHTSMAVVPSGDSVPAIGASVDVQRPLIATAVDRIEWI